MRVCVYVKQVDIVSIIAHFFRGGADDDVRAIQQLMGHFRVAAAAAAASMTSATGTPQLLRRGSPTSTQTQTPSGLLVRLFLLASGSATHLPHLTHRAGPIGSVVAVVHTRCRSATAHVGH